MSVVGVPFSLFQEIIIRNYNFKVEKRHGVALKTDFITCHHAYSLCVLDTKSESIHSIVSKTFKCTGNYIFKHRKFFFSATSAISIDIPYALSIQQISETSKVKI